MSDAASKITDDLLARSALRSRDARIKRESVLVISRYRRSAPQRQFHKSRIEDAEISYAAGFNAGAMAVIADLIARGIIDSLDGGDWK